MDGRQGGDDGRRLDPRADRAGQPGWRHRTRDGVAEQPRDLVLERRTPERQAAHCLVLLAVTHQRAHALEADGDLRLRGPRRDAHRRRDLVVGEVLEVAQHDRRALAGGELLEQLERRRRVGDRLVERPWPRVSPRCVPA